MNIPVLLASHPNHISLRVNNLQCIRDDRVLFDRLHFTVNTGQLLQIEGANGTGKTSLLRILCGLMLPTEGQIFWGEQDIEHVKAQYWENLLYIGHHNGIKGDLTPLENLTLARALGSCATEVTLEDALAYMGLRGFEDVPTRTLSAGQQRRVALARLLLTQAPLWILDEPFTALDKKAILHFENLLDTHAHQGGMAILTSHHTVNCRHAKIFQLRTSRA
jgi:heme exporter protein A